VIASLGVGRAITAVASKSSDQTTRPIELVNGLVNRFVDGIVDHLEGKVGRRLFAPDEMS
jgi:hypothetical protein